jgi:hypothetical protein
VLRHVGPSNCKASSARQSPVTVFPGRRATVCACCLARARSRTQCRARDVPNRRTWPRFDADSPLERQPLGLVLPCRMATTEPCARCGGLRWRRLQTGQVGRRVSGAGLRIHKACWSVNRANRVPRRLPPPATRAWQSHKSGWLRHCASRNGFSAAIARERHLYGPRVHTRSSPLA